MSTKISELSALSGGIPATNAVPISVDGTTYKVNLGNLAEVSGSADVLSALGAANKAALSDAVVDGTAISPTSLNISTNGDSSTPVITLSGSWFSGGSTTTTKPIHLIEPSGATSTGWSTSGTGLGINSSTGFIGNLIDTQLNSVTSFKVNYQGQVSVNSNGSFGNTSGTVALLEFYNGLRFGNQSNVGISWSDSVSPNSSVDIGLYRDAIGVLAQRSGTTPQEHRIYSTYTSSTNYERLSTKYDSGAGAFVIGTEQGASGGSARSLIIQNNIDMAVAFAIRNVAGTDIFGVNTTDRFVQMGGDAFGVSTSTGKTYIYNGGQLVWNNSATASNTGSADVGIARLSAGQLKITDSSSGFGAISSLYQRFGSGSPEGVVTAPVGATYNRTDGGAGTSFYVKESGSGNTGWVAK